MTPTIKPRGAKNTEMKKNTGSSIPNRPLNALCRKTLNINTATDIPAVNKNILSILNQDVGVEVNCYPGVPGNACHQLAFFISLSGKRAKGRGHISFERILEILVRHVQGICIGVTKHVVLITDSWNAAEYEKWQPNIKAIKDSGVVVEAHLLVEGSVVTIFDTPKQTLQFKSERAGRLLL